MNQFQKNGVYFTSKERGLYANITVIERRHGNKLRVAWKSCRYWGGVKTIPLYKDDDGEFVILEVLDEKFLFRATMRSW